MNINETNINKIGFVLIEPTNANLFFSQFFTFYF